MEIVTGKNRSIASDNVGCRTVLFIKGIPYNLCTPLLGIHPVGVRNP